MIDLLCHFCDEIKNFSNLKYYWPAANAAFHQAEYLSNAGSYQPTLKSKHVVVFYLSDTYFQFQFPLFVCFYSMPD